MALRWTRLVALGVFASLNLSGAQAKDAGERPKPAPTVGDAKDPAPKPATPPKAAAPSPSTDPKSYYVPTRGYRLEPQPDIPPYVRNLGKTYKQFEGIDWLNVGLDTRLRFEYRKDDYRPWTDTTTDPPVTRRRYVPNSLWLLRTRAYLGVQNILDPLRFAVEFQDSRAFNSLYELQGQEINETDLISAYGELFFKDVFDKDARGNDRPLSVRAGRMHFELLDRRLIAENEFRNTTNTFDGVRVKIGKKDNDWDLDSFVMRPVVRLPYAFDRPDWQNWVYGSVLSVRRWSEYATIQPYFIGRKQYANISATAAPARVQRDIYAPGLRIYGVLGNFDYDIDVNKQFGQIGEILGGQQNPYHSIIGHDALAYAFEAGYTFPDHPWKPRISAAYAYGTGNSSPFDYVNQTFDPLYGFNQPFSRNDYIAWNNVRAPKVRLEFAPAKDLQIDTAFSAYWLGSAAAAWDRANLVAPLGNRGTFMGTEVDFRARYKLSPFVNLSASYARFWPGGFTTSFAPPVLLQPALPQSFPGQTGTTNGLTAKPTDFFYLEMTANGFGDGQPIAGNPARDWLGLQSDEPPARTSPPSWRDIYVGVNVGGAWATPRNSVSTSPLGISPYSPLVAQASQMAPADFNLSGLAGGFQIGGNYRFNNNMVVGLEADLRGVSDNRDRKTQLAFSQGPGNAFLTFGDRFIALNYLGTVRPRLGYLLTPALQLFGTGGVAYAGVTSSAGSTTDRVGGITTTYGNPFYEDTRLGWTAGAGLEWAFTQNWSAKAEYLHYDLGTKTVSTGLAHPGGFYWFNMNSRTAFDGNLIQAGLNRHFDMMGKN